MKVTADNFNRAETDMNFGKIVKGTGIGNLSHRREPLWGIETSIVVPGAFTGGTNHFAHSGTPADKQRVAEYEAGPYKGYGKKIQETFAAIVPPDADAGAVSDATVKDV